MNGRPSQRQPAAARGANERVARELLFHLIVSSSLTTGQTGGRKAPDSTTDIQLVSPILLNCCGKTIRTITTDRQTVRPSAASVKSPYTHIWLINRRINMNTHFNGGFFHRETKASQCGNIQQCFTWNIKWVSPHFFARVMYRRFTAVY